MGEAQQELKESPFTLHLTQYFHFPCQVANNWNTVEWEKIGFLTGMGLRPWYSSSQPVTTGATVASTATTPNTAAPTTPVPVTPVPTRKNSPFPSPKRVLRPPPSPVFVPIPTASPSPSPSPVRTPAQTKGLPIYSQCGGINMPRVTCTPACQDVAISSCSLGDYCARGDPWYWQCIPNGVTFGQ